METLAFRAVQDGERIDRYLSGCLEDLSRSYIQKLVKDGNIRVDGRIVKANYKLSAGEEIRVLVPEPEVPDIHPALVKPLALATVMTQRNYLARSFSGCPSLSPLTRIVEYPTHKGPELSLSCHWQLSLMTSLLLVQVPSCYDMVLCQSRWAGVLQAASDGLSKGAD